MKSHWVGLGVLAVALVLGCRGDDPGPVAAPVEPPEVATTAVRLEQIVEPILGTGIIAAHKTTQIGPRVDGIVEAIYVDVGDPVRAGQRLFRTRDADSRLRVRERAASVQLAEAELSKATLDLERIEELRRQLVVSAERLDDSTTAYRIAAAKLERTRAELAVEEQALADTVVVAPYDGIITQRTVDEGTFLRAMIASSGALEIMKTDVVLAIVHVAEVHLTRIALGTPAVVRVDGVDREFETEVQVLNHRVETTSHAVELRLRIANPDLLLKPGLFVKVELRPPPRPALVMLRGAVLGPPDARFVFLCREGIAVRRSVVVRDLDAERLEVLSGLGSGDRILVGPGLGQIEDGTPIADPSSSEALRDATL